MTVTRHAPTTSGGYFLPVARVWRSCWRDEGPATEEMTEDGPRVRLPDREPVVLVETPDGELYLYSMPLSARMADTLVRRVRSRSVIDTTHWTFHRAVYGSPAYEALGYEADAMRFN